MVGYWPSSLFAFLCTETKSRSTKTQKRTRPISSYLDQTSLIIMDLLYSIPRLHLALNFYFCVCRFLSQNVFLKLINIFVFFVFMLVDACSFLVFLLYPREITENLFTVMENILRKNTFVQPLGLGRNFIAGTKPTIPSV